MNIIDDLSLAGSVRLPPTPTPSTSPPSTSPPPFHPLMLPRSLVVCIIIVVDRYKYITYKNLISTTIFDNIHNRIIINIYRVLHSECT